MKMQDMDSFCWSLYRLEPVILHPALSPVLADPTFLYPHETPDGLWHLFAHSAWGLHHYLSRDGAEWKDEGVRIWNAMRAHLYRENGVYYLSYERYKALGLALSWVPGRVWRSTIEQRTSRDLRHWSPPRTLVEPVLGWQQKAGMGASVGNPCIVKSNGGYRLYFSASLILIPDCGFNEPESIGLAEADRPDGPFTVRPEPIMRPDADDPLRNLSCGSLKAVKMEDGFIGFQNGISWDAALCRSSSAILLLKSADGVRWEYLKREPILRPTEGWMRSHVYACDAKPGQDGDWRLYFNARDGWALWEGKENIGLAVGKRITE